MSHLTNEWNKKPLMNEYVDETFVSLSEFCVDQE